MKKNNFLQGAFIATIGIILSKILGIIYVIPFFSLVGAKGGALYGYAYSIYTIFLGMSEAGIPVAISKIISEYHNLGYNDLKERTFKLAKNILIMLGIICFIIMFIFSKSLANIIIGNISGGNSMQDVTYVIRVISFALLIVPLVSVYKGYLEGHNYIQPASISQVIEQIIRVTIIIFGSYITLKILKLSLKKTIALAVFAASIGALFSYFYLLFKIKKHKNQFKSKTINNNTINISNKEIIKKIFIYSIPFVMIDIFRSLINSVDVFMLIKILVNNLSFSINDAEEIMSVISTWGQKINMIIISICSGIIISLVPNLTSSFIKKDYKDVNLKINQSIKWAAYLTIPMTIGISFLAKPIWIIFYGNHNLSISVYKFYVFVTLANIIFTIGVVSLQLLGEHKKVLLYLIIGFLTNVMLNIPLLYLFDYLNLPAYYGSITSTIIGYSISGLLSLIYIKIKYQINYKDSLKNILNITLLSIIMLLFLNIIKLFFPLSNNSNLINIIYILVYSLIGFIIYIYLSFKAKLIYQIFDYKLPNSLKLIFKIKEQ